MSAPTVYWLCMTCGARGDYPNPETKTDTGPAVKHGHSTISTLSAGVVERLAAS